MKIVVFGLTVSSSWGNGHATLWRGLIDALARRGHRVVFYERDLPYYAEARDLDELPGGELVIFPSFGEIAARARRDLQDADVAIVTSYCVDAIAATRAVLEAARPLKVFYDLDTPVTLERALRGEWPDYIGPDGLSGFDLALSYTGGPALEALCRVLRARRAIPLYGHVDPQSHRPASPDPRFRADLTYLGTYAADRQAELERLFVEPARRAPERRFLIGGAQYPADFPWAPNIWFVRHVPPPEHPAFYVSGRLTLNVTRAAMAAMGWCPSGRLFEAAACGAPIVSDAWPGLETFFEPGREIIVASSADEVEAALALDDATLARIAGAAREKVLARHSSDRRVQELERILDGARHPALTEA